MFGTTGVGEHVALEDAEGRFDKVQPRGFGG
jgi:hypothetical protein